MADSSETKFFHLVGLPWHLRGPVWVRLPHLRGRGLESHGGCPRVRFLAAVSALDDLHGFTLR
eukprot:277922-Alexandrium_andersonii.AAC.1